MSEPTATDLCLRVSLYFLESPQRHSEIHLGSDCNWKDREKVVSAGVAAGAELMLAFPWSLGIRRWAEDVGNGAG